MPNGLTAAVDGKAACAMRDENDDPLLMLNVFVHDLKITLDQWSVRGDKTNEPGCLQNDWKRHFESLFETYPMLRLLTGDAIYAQRPLLEVLKEYDCDYLFQIEKNQKRTYAAVESCFCDAENQEPHAINVSKKREVEVRKLWSDLETAQHLRDCLDIPNCQIVLRVDREVFGKDGQLKLHDIRYFITSLDPDLVTPRDLQKFVRDHWQVETSLPYFRNSV